MHRIPCPWCGTRDESEFQYRGDASVRRPPATASQEAFTGYVYERDNPKGLHREYWHHTAGCRQFLIVERDTATHRVVSGAFACADDAPAP